MAYLYKILDRVYLIRVKLQGVYSIPNIAFKIFVVEYQHIGQSDLTQGAVMCYGCATDEI